MSFLAGDYDPVFYAYKGLYWYNKIVQKRVFLHYSSNDGEDVVQVLVVAWKSGAVQEQPTDVFYKISCS